ncbi:MAG: cupin domain-containing protein [Rariglobus sp.]|nr:cupin domain-containing protein [Rariglobus sp.]
MKNTTSLPPPDTPWIISKPVLNEAGLNGDLKLLSPGASHVPEQTSPGETLLFVAAGSITAAIDINNFVLQPETTLRIPPGRRYELRNPTEFPAKVLVLTLPPPRIVSPSNGLVTLRG